MKFKLNCSKTLLFFLLSITIVSKEGDSSENPPELSEYTLKSNEKYIGGLKREYPQTK